MVIQNANPLLLPCTTQISKPSRLHTHIAFGTVRIMAKAVKSVGSRIVDAVIAAGIGAAVLWILNNANVNTQQILLKAEVERNKSDIAKLETANVAHDVMLNDLHNTILAKLTQVSDRLGRIEGKVGIVGAPWGNFYASPDETERGY